MRARLGDDIDDFCVKCKRIMNHAVVSLIAEEPAKVRCKTCHSDHDYRHEQPPPPKVDPRKAAAQASAEANGAAPEAAPAAVEAEPAPVARAAAASRGRTARKKS